MSELELVLAFVISGGDGGRAGDGGAVLLHVGRPHAVGVGARVHGGAGDYLRRGVRW
ncbi:MAG: hypothetical protein U0694_23000 [Anaerolineae bacterium]